MKSLNYTVAALAVIALASFTSSAMAQTTPATGDLIFGAYDTNNTGLASYELDLGSFGSLTNGETWNLGSTVTSAFSSDSSASLLWNIAATGGSAGGSTLARKEVALTVESLPSLPANNTTEYGAIANLYSGFSAGTSVSLPSNTSSNGAAIEAATVSSGSSNSFETQFVQGSANGGYGYGPGFSDTYPSSDSVTLELIPNVTSGASTDGVFVLSNGGDTLTYNPTATPEPSAYALALCAVALFWVLKRRNSIA